MRILHTGTTYYPSLNGQAVFTVNLAEGLAQRGHDVLVAVPSNEIEPYQKERKGTKIEGIKSISLKRWHQDAYLTLFADKAIEKILDDFQPDIVHIHDHYPLCRVFAMAAQRRKIKCVGTNHFMPENLASYATWFSQFKPVFNFLLWQWMLEVYNRTHAVTAQSKNAAELVRQQGLRPPIFAVSCGIDLRRFRPDPTIDRRACRERYGLDPNRKVFLFVGRVDGEKMLHIMIRAMALVKRDDIQFAIAGRGEAKKDLMALAEELKLGDRVRFTGFIPNEDLHPLLNSADVFTMPSEAELLSLATLEAMACGRPVLLANAVALPELVTEGVNGYLFKPSDPADAAKYIDLMASQPECWPEMGRASVAKAQFHGLDYTVERYEMLYEHLLTGKPLSDLAE